ncbi:hypothetical protein BJ138DRAFT_996387 [Hygrophoropsis aurantiaca]|uniref:Uncharacterized protein n=1 Tax=Hygrophoropsis aurantiaca TaxID=72124 RepID=A0ACB8AS38_9AGAM|nr:hypothetical protein BJ138DRAFT_996387 [Hygrophoropsis aurantiaca]
MPVPVPVLSKPSAHPVYKPPKTGDSAKYQSSVFSQLKQTLPVSPTGPPPSFGSRDQWINSLPSWRRTKTRRIWEDDSDRRPATAMEHSNQSFPHGLMQTGNASTIKGAHVQTCIPPLSVWALDENMHTGSTYGYCSQAGAIDQEMDLDHVDVDLDSCDHEGSWDICASTKLTTHGIDPPSSLATEYAWSQLDGMDCELDAGVFSPVLEDDSPGMVHSGELGSSPVGPLTPFGDYIDRAVSATHPSMFYNALVAKTRDAPYSHEGLCGPECNQYASLDAAKDVPVSEACSSVSLPYKKLAEPIADWMISYVWKACAHALRLPSSVCRYRASPIDLELNPVPTYLAGSVHSLLMSTLLQPSAILLALWYIARLPIRLKGVEDSVKEARFRAELFADRCTSDGDVAGNPTFRLIVLGCMLANKWLDDHTFSNKTWHTISGVPTQSLNKLEFLALEIFCHDLSITPSAWSEWLNHLLSYHQLLSSHIHPQPISRPSSSPHSIIRTTIEEIARTPESAGNPVFLGLEQRTQEKLGMDTSPYQSNVDGVEIDLDEDGPLREEYLPKRRTSNGSSYARQGVVVNSRPPLSTKNHFANYQLGVALPPPAKWSPAGDEPIFRERNLANGHYMAVQPLAPQYAPPVSAPYQQWPSGTAYVPVFEPSPFQHGFPHHPVSYPYGVSMNLSHVRSQSQSYCEMENFVPSHGHSYSQPRYDYRCSDVPISADRMGPASQPNGSWPPMEYYRYRSDYRNFGPHSSINPQSTWARA